MSGATIATLILFPLVNALALDDGYWLHWRSQDSIETLVAWAAIGSIVAATIAIAESWLPRNDATEAVHAAWLLVGGFFFSGAIVKSDALRDFATVHRAASLATGVLLGSAFVVLAVACMRWARRRGGLRMFERLTAVLAPLVLVFSFQLAKAQWNHQDPPPDRLASVSASTQMRTTRPRVRTLVLLFDELSPDYLYGAESGELAHLPALRRLVAGSRTYQGAFLRGGETRLAVPALFGAGMPSRDAPPTSGQTSGRGWLARAVERGLDVRVSGWHLDYCTGIAAAATRCRAASLYNPRTFDSGFSVLHPLWTTLNLLPGDLPFGFAKIPAALRMHEATRDSALSWMLVQLADDRADVVFVHVNVPHVPFLADEFEGFQRFVVTRDRYVRQLRFVDTFVETTVQAIDGATTSSRPTRLVVLSDHNVRRLTPNAAHEHVVFLVRPPGGGGSGSMVQPQDAGDLLARIVSDGA